MEFNPNKTHAHDERQIKNGKKILSRLKGH